MRRLPGFLEKNRIPEESALSIEILREMLAAGDTSIVTEDAAGEFRFHPDLSRAGDLSRLLDRLAEDPAWEAGVARDRSRILDLYEEVFHHATWTGRSGTMYGYEGLGCVYWHMVSKLLLAVQEVTLRAVDAGDDPQVVRALARHYYRIRAGLGFEKTPLEYGAFPTDPYSHTPAHAGAQQPGMTGQVKEEILTRFGELGVRAEDGIVSFHPVMLRDTEFTGPGGPFRGVDVAGRDRVIDVPAGGLAFTFVQVPVVYTRTPGEAFIRVARADGAVSKRPGDRLDADESRALLSRDGSVVRIDVAVPEKTLLSIPAA
jgi:hypothetical protein